MDLFDDMFGDMPTREGLLLAASALLLLGFLGFRISARLRLPVVTIFMLLGILIGPSGFGLLSTAMVDSLGIIETVALGFITFSAGEQLLLSELRVLAGTKRRAVILETVLPVVFVGSAVYVWTGSPALALCLGTISGTTGIATVVATLRESGASGEFTRLLNTSIATDNVFAILTFGLVLPAATVWEGASATGSLYARGFAGIAVSLALGAAAGMLLARFIPRVRSPAELSILVLSLLFLAVSLASVMRYSVLLTGLTIGIVASNLVGTPQQRERLFTSLLPLEGPLIAVFFLWAGATLHIQALGSVGIAAVIYVAARTAGKLAGPFIAIKTAPGSVKETRSVRLLGLALLPQAGAAIGLAIRAGDALPALGDEILTVVLASVVLFELAGPLTVRLAVRSAGEVAEHRDDQPMTLNEALTRLNERRGKVMAVVDAETDAWDAVSLLGLANRLGSELLLVSLESAGAESGGEQGAGPAWPGTDMMSAIQDALASLQLQATVVRRDIAEPSKELVDMARASDADLLILAWGRVDHRALSSSMLERAPCPVVEFPLTHPPLGTERADLPGGRRDRAVRFARALGGRARKRARAYRSPSRPEEDG